MISLALGLPVKKLQAAENPLFLLLRNRFSAQMSSYDKKVAANKENGSKGGRPRKNPEEAKAEKKKPRKTEKNPVGFDGLEEKPTGPQYIYNINQDNPKQDKLRQDIYLDDDDDDVSVRACVGDLFSRYIGREPLPGELTSIIHGAEAIGAEMDLVEELMERAGRYGSQSPAAYIASCLRDCGSKYIRTRMGLEQDKALADASNGRIPGMDIVEANRELMAKRKERELMYG